MTQVTSIEVGSGEVLAVEGKHLHRNFRARHVQMIGLAGCIGSGVFIAIGEVSSNERPTTLPILMPSEGSANRRCSRAVDRLPLDMLNGIGNADGPVRSVMSLPNVWILH